MRREGNLLAADTGDELAGHRRGAGAAERGVGGDGKQEGSATILHMNDEAARRVVDRVGCVDVGLAAVERDECVAEVELHARGTGVWPRDAKTVNGSDRIRARQILKA